MPPLSVTRLLAIQEGPDISVEAVVVAAIRLHEWVETNLRRLAMTQISFSSGEVAAAVSEARTMMNARKHRNGIHGTGTVRRRGTP
jgi:hypothetical protein